MIFGTPSCVLATTSKNALGLCFMGDTTHLSLVVKEPKAILSTKPYRLLKVRDNSVGGEASHPLKQQASEGFAWTWLPYAPGGPPIRAPGEFSVPVDQGEVDAILSAVAAQRSVPVFGHADARDSSTLAATFADRKDLANRLFKRGEYVKALKAYDFALSAGAPSNADASTIHSNAAQTLLNMAVADKPRAEACAAEAMKRALTAAELDASNTKAHLRCAAACDILGEAAAAAEARAKAEQCAAVQAAAEAKQKEAKELALVEKRKVDEACAAAAARAEEEKSNREIILERERARERALDEAEAAKARVAEARELNSMLGY